MLVVAYINNVTPFTPSYSAEALLLLIWQWVRNNSSQYCGSQRNLILAGWAESFVTRREATDESVSRLTSFQGKLYAFNKKLASLLRKYFCLSLTSRSKTQQLEVFWSVAFLLHCVYTHAFVNVCSCSAAQYNQVLFCSSRFLTALVFYVDRLDVPTGLSALL